MRQRVRENGERERDRKGELRGRWTDEVVTQE